jgi:cell division protein ZapA
MAHVSVTVNGRRYDIGCDDGQEDDVRRLAAELDRRVGGMAASVGQVGDARLLVMAGLLMAHELEQVRPAPPSSAPAEAPGAEDATEPASQETPEGAGVEAVEDEALCERIERLAMRIEAVVRRLEPAADAS